MHKIQGIEMDDLHSYYFWAQFSSENIAEWSR